MTGRGFQSDSAHRYTGPMSVTLLVVVFAVLGLVVLAMIASAVTNRNSPEEKDRRQRHDSRSTSSDSSSSLGFMAGASDVGGSSNGVGHGHSPTTGHSTPEYSTNNFSGPDPASDAGVSFGESGGFDSGGGGDSGGGDGGGGGGGGD